MDERVEPLPDAPEGTCIRVGYHGVWAVRGRSGWLRCNAETQNCECADFLAQRRRGQPLTPCAHLRALARHLAGLRESVNPAIHTRINGGLQAFCEERVEAMEPLSWTQADLRRLFS